MGEEMMRIASCSEFISVLTNIHSFKKYELHIYYLPGTVLDSRSTLVNKPEKNPAFLKFTF